MAPPDPPPSKITQIFQSVYKKKKFKVEGIQGYDIENFCGDERTITSHARSYELFKFSTGTNGERRNRCVFSNSFRSKFTHDFRQHRLFNLDLSKVFSFVFTTMRFPSFNY